MFHALILLHAILPLVFSLRYDPEHVGWNLNENDTAIDPLDYWGQWENHTFHPSPENWRFPFYVITLDRFVDGDPTNNEANGTNFEHDWMSSQFRFGGDAKGLMNSLDYIQGMGIKALYLSGSPFINMPWGTDGFGPLDFTLLDHHHGLIEDWRNLISEIHRRDMYVILDNTLATMGDLISFKGFENATAPFSWSEYDASYKTSRQYLDFHPGNEHNASCEYPRMWMSTGFPQSDPTVLEAMKQGCKISEFDQYGDMKGVGEVPVYETQLAKFASVQDRLRSWRSDVLDKIMHFSCMQIAMLDIDGFRVDKAAQTPVDVHSKWSTYQRNCARRYGKDNFLIVGEIVGKDAYEALIVGRGKQPDMAWSNVTDAFLAKNVQTSEDYIQEFGNGALDGAAFHYPTYGAMTRFLGLDGPIGLEGVDFVDIWHQLVMHQDMVNGNTGLFDPRHMFGMTNQDVFRWPALADGTQRHLLGLFITILHMPGIPFHLWGEEQEFYVLENQAADYVFGRTPMASSRGWQLHGCYKLGEEVYVDMPFDGALRGCGDNTVSQDHRDPSHPIRNILKRMYELRRQYPTLNEGFELQTLSTQVRDIYLPGSLGIPSPTGIWSVYRGRNEATQNLKSGQGNQGVWLIFHNDNKSVNYTFDCQNQSSALISAFPKNTTVKNLFYPYEEFDLDSSTAQLGIESSNQPNGCLPFIEMEPWGFKAFVPKERFEAPAPTITRVIPGHDARLAISISESQPHIVPIEIHFSSEMDCDSVTQSFSIQSRTGQGGAAYLNKSSISCELTNGDVPNLVGGIPTSWVFRAELANVSEGVHTFTVNNATSSAENLSTNSRDHFIFRIGRPENPIVFPEAANYSATLLNRNTDTGELFVSHTASGADKWQYSLNWGTTWSEWMEYTGDNAAVPPQPWSGTESQKWTGDHVIIRYWSELTGSSDHVQHGDVGFAGPPRRWPHMHVTGPWNEYGYDAGVDDNMKLSSEGWTFLHMTEWPSEIILNTWGMNPDRLPDKSKFYGDVDGDNILDWLPPTSLSDNVINITAPGLPFVGYKIVANDADNRYRLEPTGSAWVQLSISVLLALAPILSSISAVLIFMKSFYNVKFNAFGVVERGHHHWMPGSFFRVTGAPSREPAKSTSSFFKYMPPVLTNPQRADGFATAEGEHRKTVLIATMEYEIQDWQIKVKIGGLGVMASLMGKNLQHQNLIWVVPCVDGVDYPLDQPALPMEITIMGQPYHISVQYHRHQNITYVLLEAPIFRAQSKNEPYPSRMDDMDSAVYYSAWNQCIAETVRRFPDIDLYHINDYHGALAPLYLLNQSPLPCCLSLHNAEFQGLWPIQTSEELDEISKVFNLSKEIITKYVQFGEVFNLLHAGASYLRLHQNGFGAVGVSRKYGKRSFARYPIFWGLSRIGSLPNPDPSDTAAWDKKFPSADSITVDSAQEQERGKLRCQAQEWAGLKVDPEAELFVFVGRWSMQKGLDLIADVFPSILEKYSNVQLICIGPVIDLYGKFAALKLKKLMQMYPDRVFSKPEFTVLPPFIFGGAEFALIPSRDEPFGLVAVEFGRKGALGVGSRVGGLGQMPGWWYTVESVATKHLVKQFKLAIKNALASSKETRALMRARSLVQRFPVAQWVEDLEALQEGSIAAHRRVLRRNRSASGHNSPTASMFSSPTTTAPSSQTNSRAVSRRASRASSPVRYTSESSDIDKVLRRASERLKIGQHRPAKVLPMTAITADRVSSGFSDLEMSSERDFGYQLFPILSQDHQNPSLQSGRGEHIPEPPPARLNQIGNQMRSLPVTPAGRHTSTPPVSSTPRALSKTPSLLSLNTVVGDEKSYRLQNVDPFFTDSEEYYYKEFEKRLTSLSAKTSESDLCIEEYITRSEKDWFNRLRKAKLGISSSPAHSINLSGKKSMDLQTKSSSDDASDSNARSDEFNLGDDYRPPTGLRKLLQYKVGDWPLYSFLLALGQILAANSYQITLISGEIGQTAEKLYTVASIYLGSSIIWWLVFRRFKSVYAMSLPFVLYASAFFVLGMTPYGTSASSRGWIQNVATGLYATASGSGSLFFALNFGSEGGTAVKTWVFRACVIQGTQQIYVTVLWFWGSQLAALSNNGVPSTKLITATPIVTAITTPIAVILFAIGLVLFLGLPDYYRSSPGKVPSFYASLRRRKIIIWFFIVIVIQNYFLSAPYGRNWRYLWSSMHAPAWSIAVLVVVFFIVVWAIIFGVFSRLSAEHSWIIPIFAIGLGAPRWAQMLWGTSGMGLWVPWPGSPLAGALLGRALWLWLGLLDALQGVGFGMILLQTLTRLHISFTLMAAQVLGSVATIAARASAPDRTGPGDVFPNLAPTLEGLRNAWFWIPLVSQGVICVGFFAFFRKEQLFKP